MEDQDKSSSVFGVIVVLLMLGVAAALLLPMRRRGCTLSNGNNAGAALKQLVNHQTVWRHNDSDKNGLQDYWTHDVAGFHCIHDNNDKALAVIDLSFARADKAPAAAYFELAAVNAPRQGYFYQAMTRDQDGRSYLQSGLPAPWAKAVPPGINTNASRFGFTAFPAVYGSDGTLVYIVSEDGVVWQQDIGVAAPVLDRKKAAPEPTGSGWAGYGG